MTKSKNTIAWKDVNAVLSKHDKHELLMLLKSLYALNEENRIFFQTKYKLIDPLEPYKQVISDSINPDLMDGQTIRLKEGRNAISRYKKAVGDADGTIELMIYYVECGNQLTLNYGDIYEEFYNSLESMFSSVVKKLKNSDKKTKDKYLPGLQKVVNEVNGLGWGYYDSLYSIYANAFGCDGLF